MAEMIKEVVKDVKEAVSSLGHKADFPEVQQGPGPELTLANGAPFQSNKEALTAGPTGPMLLQDISYFQKLAKFNREKIPERTVHAHGSGAYGTFTVTKDISKYTCASVFSSIGKKTKVLARFSTVAPEKGSADMQRDPRGFAIKFYSDDGNWDLVGNNTPVFFIRDPSKFPDLMHSFQRDPRNNDRSPIPMWDFFSLTPESLHQVTILFSDRGIPLSYRHMHGFGLHTFSLINKDNKKHWVKFHWVCQQDIKNFDRIQASLMSGQDPDFVNRDLYKAIKKGDYPKWKLCIQVMPEEKGYTYPGAFDVTKVWSHKEFPLIEVGEMQLNQNVTNYFAEIEQAAFSPGNLVPGISFSPDRLLQGRAIMYEDAQRYRLGASFDQLPVNKAVCPMHNYYKDGSANLEITNKFPSWEPNSFGGPITSDRNKETPLKVDGSGYRYSQVATDTDWDYYKQAGDLFRLMPEDAKIRLTDSIAASLETVPKFIRDRMLLHFHKADPRYGDMVHSNLQLRLDKKMIRTESEVLKERIEQVLEKDPKQPLMSHIADSLKKLSTTDFAQSRTKAEVSL